MKTGVLLSTVLLLATATVPNALAFTETENNTNENGVSVNIKQIKELADNNLLPSDATPSQALAQTLASLVSHDPSGDNGNFTEVLDANDVLKYFYPNYTEEQLKGATITPTQGAEWLHSKGYNATIIDRALTTDEIKKRLDASEPIVTVLQNQNQADWLDSNYAGILYAHDDVETGTAEGKLHASFIKTVNYGEAIVNDGTEANAFQFPDLKNAPDPIQAESSFKWVSTITGIKRDPSWTNSQTISGDRAKGVFEHKVTSDGTQSQVDFTDPDVTSLLNKYPQENTDQVMKLSAVSLINLYEDKEHQKTVKDLETFLKIDNKTYATAQNIIDWYKYLGFDFDVVDGRAPMKLTKAINDSGRLYLTMFKPLDKNNAVKSTAVVGAGYLNNSFAGYSPSWYALKLGENIVPFYDVPMTNEGLAQQQELAKEFKYTNAKRVVSEPFSKTDYEEDKTIYNIRLKGTPDESGITDKPDESVVTPPDESNMAPTTNATYAKEPDFHIREIQGQQPWCSEYTNAAAVNTVYKAPLDDGDTKGAVTAAKKIMQLDRPGVSDKELENLPGTTVQHILQVLQDNYKVTADFEMRALSFAEVKKEIDAGGIVQMDGNNSEASDVEGTGDNLGHSVAIVGYVTPTEGNQSPYYIVWNPWWDTTFYLSTNAKTYNLGGVKYQWTRTWHNWRKTDGTRSVRKLAPSIGNQKVMSTPNPAALKVRKQTFNLGLSTSFNKKLLNFGITNKDIQTQNVAQFGAERSVYAPFYGDEFGYSESLDSNKSYMKVRYNKSTKTVSYGNGAAFSKDVDGLIDIGDELTLTGGLTIAYYSALIIVGITFPEATIIVSAMENLGIVVKGMSPIEAARLIIKYIDTVNDTKSAYNGLHV